MSTHRCRTVIPLITIILGVIIVSIIPLVIWALGLTSSIRTMSVFALITALTLVTGTVIMLIVKGFQNVFGEHCDRDCRVCCLLRKYVPVILIAATVLIICCLAIIAISAAFSFAGKFILGLISAVSFAVMLITFMAMMIDISGR